MSKSQWIFVKFDNALILCRSGLGLLIGKFCQFMTELSAHNMIMARYYHFTFLLNWILASKFF